MALSATSQAATFSWNTTASSNWNNAANWTGGVVPNAQGAYVVDAKTTTLTTTADISPTVGALVYYNTAGTTTWTISSSASGGPFSITMDNTGGGLNPWGDTSGAAIVSISKGHFTVNSNVIMTGDLYAGTAGSSQTNVIINGNITSSSPNAQTLFLRTDTNSGGGNGTYQSNGSIGASGGTINILEDIDNGSNAASVTLSGPLGPSVGSVTMAASTGLMIISSSANTYTGPTNITAGTLQIGSGGSGETLASLSIGDSGTLAFNHSDSFNYPGTISGPGALFNLGAGNTTLSGSASYSGATKLSAGSLTIDTTVGNTSLSGSITGAGALTKIGPNVLLLNNPASNFTGNIVVSSGTLQASANIGGAPSASSLGSLTTAGRTITVKSGAVLECTVANALGAGGQTVSTPLVINAGGLVTTDDGDNNNLGPVTLSGGTLAGASGGASGNFLTWQLTGGSVTVNTAPSLITVSGATNPGINMAASTTFNVGLTGTGGSVSANPDLTVAANLGDIWGHLQNSGNPSSLVKIGAGTMLLASSNSFSGTTTVNGGALVLGDPNSLSLSTFNASGSGTLSFGTLPSATFGGLTGSGTLSLTNGAGSAPVALTVGANSNNSTFSGTLTDAGLGGSLTKIGTGTLTMAGNNTYSGPTAVSNGALAVSGSLRNTAVTVASGATLAGSGNAFIGGGNVNVNGGGALGLAVANSAAPLTLANGLTLGSTAGGYGAGNYANLNYVLGASGIQPISLGGSALALNSGGGFVNVTGPSIIGNYTLMSFGGTNGSGQFSLSPSSVAQSVTVGRDVYTLVENPTSLQLAITGVPNPGVAYFYGAVSSVWNDLSNSTSCNWSLDINGTQDATNFPGAPTDVIMSATNQSGSAVATTLGANFVINSLNINSQAASTTIGNPGDTTTLTINALADSHTNSSGYTGNPAGNGISIDAAAGPLTINVPVVVGNSQTWTNSSTGALTVTGSVQGSAGIGATQTLTLADAGGGTTLGAAIANGNGGGNLSVVINDTGAGATVFIGANTYSGTTTIAGGTLVLGNTAALSMSTFDASGSGSLNFGTLSAAVFGGLQGSATSTLSLSNSNFGAISLAVGANNSNTTFSGSLNDSGLGSSLVKTGTGMLTLGGNNSYSGATLINAGTLAVTGTGSLAGSTSAVEVGTTVGSPAALVFGPASATNLAAFNAPLTVAYGSSVTIPAGASFTTAGFVKIGSLANGSPGTFNQSGGTVSINGIDSANGSRSLTIGEFSGETSTYNLSGGSLSVPNGVVYLAWAGNGILNITGGTASFGKISCGITTNACTSSLELTGGGALYLGSGGLVKGSSNTPFISLDNGTLGSTAPWTSSLPLTLTYAGGTNFDTSGGNITLSGVLSGSGGMTIVGGNALVLGTGAALASSFSGNILVSSGTLEANGTANAPNPTATALGNPQLANRTITVGNGGVLFFNQANVLASGSSIIQTPIVIDNGGLVTIVNNMNNVIGPLTLSGGTLAGGNGGASGKFLTYQLSAGTVTVNTAPSLIAVSGGASAGINMGQNSSAGTISTTTFNVGLTGTGGTVSANPDLTVAASLGDIPGVLQFSGSPGFSASLVKTGAGTMLLASSNSYSGTTLVNGGALVLGDTASLIASTFDSSGAGTLSFGTLSSATFGGLQGATGALALTSSGGLIPVALTVGKNNGSTTFSGMLSDAGLGSSLKKIGTGTLTLSGTNTYIGGTTVTNGELIVTSPTAIDAGNVGTNLNVGNGLGAFPAPTVPSLPASAAASAAIAPVPEPATLALAAAAAIVGIGAWRRKERRRTVSFR
jgi:autotransporter-associated beta strand protein